MPVRFWLPVRVAKAAFVRAPGHKQTAEPGGRLSIYPSPWIMQLPHQVVVQLGRTLARGARDRRFESCQPDVRIKQVSRKDHGNHLKGAWRVCPYDKCARMLCVHNVVLTSMYKLTCPCNWGRYPRWVRYPDMKTKTPVAIKRSIAMRKPKQPRKY